MVTSTPLAMINTKREKCDRRWGRLRIAQHARAEA